MKKISISEKFGKFSDHWSPRVIAESNGQLVKLAKGKGDLVWHSHANEDELFLVFKGKLRLEFRDGEPVELGPGEMCIVPKGVEHRPVAEEETEIMLIEPASTQHTGETVSEQTVATDKQEWI
ncbi:MAG: cupin domain-containing protein [Gammaproteobacteria bacterium]|nr:cupin domain-containing protein [Gammaproteobacteria bacterium]